MRKIRTAVLTSVAAIAATGAAMAATQNSHSITVVALPDGLVANIEYRGEVPPNMTVTPALTMPLPIGFVDRYDVAPVALFDRMFGEMGRQADVMIGQLAALEAQPFQADGVIDRLRAGAPTAVRYSSVTTSSGRGTWSRSVITLLGAEHAPKMVSTLSGDCTASSPEGTLAVAPPSEGQPNTAKVSPNLSTAASGRRVEI
jgi:hypothetical protein